MYISIFNSSGLESPILQILAIILTFAGSISVTCAVAPQFLMIYKTKNTVSLNKVMFSCHIFVGIFYTLSSLFMLFAIGERSTFSGVDYAELIQFILLFILNVAVALAFTYMLMLKFQHQSTSEKLGISELEHYNKHICNSLQTKENVSDSEKGVQ